MSAPVIALSPMRSHAGSNLRDGSDRRANGGFPAAPDPVGDEAACRCPLLEVSYPRENTLPRRQWFGHTRRLETSVALAAAASDPTMTRNSRA
jgi:hypothetical protein